jgi:hypothetical protein
MCRGCDQFEPAAVADALHSNSYSRFRRQITRARAEGVLQRVPLEDANASLYQCVAGARLFRLTGDYSNPTGWSVENPI